jgi:hypothetical protein
MGLRLSGGFLETDHGRSIEGIQFGIIRRIDDVPPMEQDLSLSVGYFRSNVGSSGSKWDYFSGNYSLLWGSFYLETGLSVGAGDFTSPQLLIQVGYIFAKSRRK